MSNGQRSTIYSSRASFQQHEFDCCLTQVDLLEFIAHGILYHTSSHAMCLLTAPQGATVGRSPMLYQVIGHRENLCIDPDQNIEVVALPVEYMLRGPFYLLIAHVQHNKLIIRFYGDREG